SSLLLQPLVQVFDVDAEFFELSEQVSDALLGLIEFVGCCSVGLFLVGVLRLQIAVPRQLGLPLVLGVTARQNQHSKYGECVSLHRDTSCCAGPVSPASRNLRAQPERVSPAIAALSSVLSLPRNSGEALTKR